MENEAEAAFSNIKRPAATGKISEGENTLHSIEALRTLPWYSIDEPADVRSGRGMVHPDERRMLYTLARDYFSGVGKIVDAGTFLGSSSLALGLGLKDRGYQSKKVIEAYDLFVIDAFSVLNHIDPTDDLSKNLSAGDNMRSLYDRNVEQVSHYIQVHEGDVLQTKWGSDPIEILFCDISKGLDINDYIITEWIPRILPEVGILIQQDQVQQYHVWIAVTMEMLSDYFEVVDYTLNSSMVYRMKSEIPLHALDRCLTKNVSHADLEHYYSKFLHRFRTVGMGRYTGWRLGMVELGLAVVYGFHIGDTDKAKFVLRAIEERFHAVPDTMYRLAEIRKHLDEGTPCPGSRLYWQ